MTAVTDHMIRCERLVTMLSEAHLRRNEAHQEALDAMATLITTAGQLLVRTRDEWALPADILGLLQDDTRSAEYALVKLTRAHDVLVALENLR